MALAGEEQRPLLGPTYAPTREDAEAPPVIERRIEKPAGARRNIPVTPLPMKQLSILLSMRICESLTFSTIYPFVAELVNATGITGGDSSKVGYYAGVIESTFFLTESLLVLQYGRMSDRIGRRPVLLFGLFGLTLSMFSFGLSKTFWGLVFTRALAGALNGNSGVVKSMITELTDETNQAQCFAFLPLTYSAGATFGPFIGGMLSNPAKSLPWVFDTPFWNKYPYFLPCLIPSVFTGVVFVLSAFYLKETHHPMIESKPHDSTNETEYGAVTLPIRPSSVRAPSLSSVLTKRASIAIINYAVLSLSDITYAGLIPIMFTASVQGGGLGLTPRSVGLVLGLQGVITGVFQVCCFAPLHRRFGSKHTFVAGLTAYMCLTLSLPIMNNLARRDMWRAVWVVMGVNLGLTCPALMAFGCISILITSAAPSKSSLGTLNGISQTTTSACRAVGPAVVTYLFALSIERNLLGGWLVYVVLTCMNIGGLLASRWLKEEKRAY